LIGKKAWKDFGLFGQIQVAVSCPGPLPRLDGRFIGFVGNSFNIHGRFLKRRALKDASRAIIGNFSSKTPFGKLIFKKTLWVNKK
jgi:hypothetical protein